MDPSMMPPGLAGYLQAQQANQQQGTAQLQQVGVLQQIMAAQEKQQQEQALRQALAQAGGDPEKAMQAALSTGDYKAAHELAPLVKMKQEAETSKLMTNAPQMTPDQLDVLAQQLALKNHSGAAQILSVADKRRKATQDAATLKTLQSSPEQTIQPDQQETQQAADGMSPPVQPATIPAQAGLFSSLAQSPFAPIATQAKMLQSAMDKSDARTISPQHWQDMQARLAAQETTLQARKDAADARTANKPDHPAYTNVQSDGKGGWIGLSRATGKMEKIPTQEGVAGAGVFSDDAIEAAAHRYRLDGTLPPNLGRGTQGTVNTARVVNRAAEQAKEQGDAPETQRLTQLSNKANTAALTQLEKQRNMIEAFKKNAVANADLVLETSAAVDRLGSPAIDRWIQAGKKNIAGDEGVANLHTAMRTFVNEYARITTSVSGGGVTSDHARREIDELLHSAMTKEQVTSVVNLMKREMDNRDKGYQQQVAELKGRITTSSKPPAQPPPTVPQQRGTVLEFDAQGNPVRK